MGWKGTVRSFNATIKRIDRDAKKRQRELDVRQKHYHKMQELEQAAYDVEVYENHIEMIRSIHRDCGEKIDWIKVSASAKPQKPLFSNLMERNAIVAKETYKPSFIDRIFNRTEAKLSKLENNVAAAKIEDEERHKVSILKWELECIDWEDSIRQANLLISGDAVAKIKTIKELNPFEEIDVLGSGMDFIVHKNFLLEVVINIHGSKIVPKEQKYLLKSGKLSSKNMPVGTFNEIYQDYVCSVVLRIANEVFSILPDKYVLINAKDKLLNTVTGHLEDQNILSVFIPRSTLFELNMDTIDPSDSMKNFVHNMSFKKTKGFDPVDTVNFESLL